MDETAALASCQELKRFAKADPGAGAPVLARVIAICQQLYDGEPDLHLLKRLRRLQDLMQDWTSQDGWQLYGQGPIVLRGELVETIAEIEDAICASSELPLGLRRHPNSGGAYRAY